MEKQRSKKARDGAWFKALLSITRKLRIGKMALLLFFLVVYGTYHLSLLPSTPGGDSGELLAEACLLGTPHPPGYPLFTLLSHLVMKLPIPRLFLSASGDGGGFGLNVDWEPTNGWRVNHMCACFGALTAVLLTCCSRDLMKSKSDDTHGVRPAHSVGALLFAFSPLVWEYSLSAEVFALNNLLCSLLMWLTCQVFACGAPHNRLVALITAGAFVCGLTMANQHASLLTLVVLVPAVLAKSFFYLRSVGKLGSTLLYSSAAFLAAFSAYLYLYLSSTRPKPGSWGSLTSLGGLLRHVLRAEYGTFQLGASGSGAAESSWKRMLLYASHSSSECFHVGSVLSVLAVLRTVLFAQPSSRTADPSGPSRSLAAVLAGAWVFYVAVWHSTLSNLPLDSPMPFGVHARFWMQPNLFLAVFTGVGATLVWDAIVPWVFGAVAGASPGPFATSEGQAKNAKRKGNSAIQIVSPALSETKATIAGLSTQDQLIWSRRVEWAFVIGILAIVLHLRFAIMDRSTSGWLMHRYAEATLQSLPPKSLLLSHTDLDWNPMRYLRECQGVRKDVTHLSFQLMPYPWFKIAQKPLYPGVVFPDTEFPGVSTGRATEGNAKLVRDVVLANGALSHTLDSMGLSGAGKSKSKSKSGKVPDRALHTPFPGGVYIDFQAVSEVELGDGHQWRGLALMPYGLVYRVVAVDLPGSVALHNSSLTQLHSLQNSLQTNSAGINFLSTGRIFDQFVAGTWEFAALSVVNDARYHVGMAMLTYSMSQQKAIGGEKDSLGLLAVLVDRLDQSAKLLTETYMFAKQGRGGTLLSSPVYDVCKNTALAWIRHEQLLRMAVEFKAPLQEALTTGDAGRYFKGLLMNPRLMDDGDVVSNVGLARVRERAIKHIGEFLRIYPQDRDAAVFGDVLKKIEQAAAE